MSNQLDQKRKEQLRKIREKVRKKKGERQRDPDEWRPPRLEADKEMKAKGFIMPPLEKGDASSKGVAKYGMDGVYFIQVGDHWINNKKHPCPRVYDNDECPVCTLGFDLIRDTQDKKARSELAKQYLPQTRFAVNIYFPKYATNPEEIRGKVVYYSMPSTMFDKLDQCLNSDGPGEDNDDPQPWGFFYDENDAYPFLIHITKQGIYNDYSQCKFLVNAQGPIAKTESKIEDVLAMRHDLVDRFPARNADNLKTLEKIVEGIMNGVDDNDSDGFDADEESKEPAPKAKPKPSKEKTEAKKAELEEELEEEPGDSSETSEAESTAGVSDDDDAELQALMDDILSKK